MKATADPLPPHRKRKPGRPRQFDTDKVLENALEMFWKRGYDDTSTRDLELGLSLNQSSLYNVFGSKQGLLDAVLDRYEAMTNNALLTPLQQSEQGLSAIERFFADLADWVNNDGRRGCMLINMMAEDGAATKTITQRTRRYRERVKAALRKSLVQAAQLGEAAVSDTDERAELLLGLVLGFNIAARGGASSSELKALLKAVRTQINGWRGQTQGAQKKAGHPAF